MANNRIWLRHRPTGKEVKLGKRMSEGWYGAPTDDKLNGFFDECERSGLGLDDFELVMEDNANAPKCSEL